MIELNENTLTSLLQLGGQYFVPFAALLRALHSGYRGKLPEGFAQILGASLFAGATAAVEQQQPDLGSILANLATNSVFVAGVLSFIVVYLLRIPNHGLLFDAIVGALLAFVAWGVWVFVLGNTELRISSIPLSLIGGQDSAPLVFATDVATLPVISGAGALLFVVLRFWMRQIGRLIRIARFFMTAGVLLVLVAAAIYFADQAGLVTLESLPIPR